MEYFIYKQDKEDLREYSEKLLIESKRYKGRIPKKKRIRDKVQKKREKERFSRFYPNEFHFKDNN